MVNDLNLVVIVGRLPRDPELKHMSSGTTLCRFTLATNRYFRRDGDTAWNQESSYIDVEAWSGVAKAAEGIAKGTTARVMGRLKQERWQDQDGNARSRIVVVAERIEWQRAKAAGAEDAADAEPAPHELDGALRD